MKQHEQLADRRSDGTWTTRIRSGVAGGRGRSIRWMWVAALVAGVFLVGGTAGCGGRAGDQGPGTPGTPGPQTLKSGCAEQTPDPRFMVVVIDTSGHATPKVVHVSKAAKQGVQWHNTGDAAVTITFQGEPLGLIVPAHCWSQAFEVQNVENGSYPYTVSTASALTPPTGPQVDVGD